MREFEDIVFTVVVVSRIKPNSPELLLTNSFSTNDMTLEEAKEKYAYILNGLDLEITRVARVRLKEVRESVS
jgi:hypothetical protein